MEMSDLSSTEPNKVVMPDCISYGLWYGILLSFTQCGFKATAYTTILNFSLIVIIFAPKLYFKL